MYIRRSLSRNIFLFPLLSIFFPLWLHAAGIPDPSPPLPFDPSIEMGVLPNGMNFWIRAHKTPPGKVSMWLHVQTGSINEDENQRGLAHFLEHMAFNGSEHFPAGTLVKYFESLGLRFGADQNASTSFDHTKYILSMPNTKDETVSKGLQCLADFAFRMSLLPEEINKERGIILEEARARKGAAQRIIDKLLPIVLPGSRVAERMPIGKEEVIQVADRSCFTNYYTQWYRPDNTTLMVVGDIDPATVRRLIVDEFQHWQPVKITPNCDPGIKPYTGNRAAVITDAELTEATVQVLNVRPLAKVLTLEDFRNQLIDQLGNWILNRRFAELVQKGAAPFQSADVSISPFLNVCTYTEAEASGQPDKWESMLNTLLMEIKRAREHGFLQQEFEDARKATLASAEQAARTEMTMDSHVFLARMDHAVSESRKPISGTQRLEMINALLPKMSLEEISAAFKQHFAPEARLLLVTMPQKEGLKPPIESEIIAVAEKAEATEVKALTAKERLNRLLEATPQPGTISKQEEDLDLKILSVTMSNGVRVHLRQMDFKKNQVLVRITFGGGSISEAAGNHGITQVAALGFSQAASDKLSSIEIRDLITGKNISVKGGTGEDTFNLAITGSPNDIEDGFQLAHLLLTQGKIEDSALKIWKQQQSQFLSQIKSSVEAQLFNRTNVLLSNNDPRHALLTQEQVEKLQLEDGQQWLNQLLKTAPIEVAIVGDIDRGQALSLALKYLGSLPERPRSDPELKKLRKIVLKKGPLESTIEVETITPRAVALVGWRGADWKDVKERRVLQLAAQILSSRLLEEVREKRGLTYSIGCRNQPAKAYQGMGSFAAMFTADPDKIIEAARLTRQVIEQLMEEGPTDAEMNTVHTQIRNQLETSLKEPGFWVDVLSDLDYHGTKLSDVKEVLEKLTSYTRSDVLEVLKKYIQEDRRIQVIAVPKMKAPVNAESEKSDK